MLMSVKTLLATTLGLTLALAGGPVPATAVATAQAGPSCGITWGSGDKAAGVLSGAPLITVRTGRHECWDRIVFELDGAANGYSVRYSPQVLTDGAGVDLVPYTAGTAFLWVTLLAPAYDAAHTTTIDARTGDRVANVLEQPFDGVWNSETYRSRRRRNRGPIDCSECHRDKDTNWHRTWLDPRSQTGAASPPPSNGD